MEMDDEEYSRVTDKITNKYWEAQWHIDQLYQELQGKNGSETD